MVIVTKTRIVQFGRLYPQSSNALNYWYKVTSNADWANISDIIKDFNNVDYVGNDHYVFNIKGNDFRLVAMIHFDIRTIYIRFIGTHAEYDKIDCSKI